MTRFATSLRLLPLFLLIAGAALLPFVVDPAGGRGYVDDADQFKVGVQPDGRVVVPTKPVTALLRAATVAIGASRR